MEELLNSIKEADGPTAVADIVKSNTRAEFAALCEDMGIEVLPKHNKKDLYCEIVDKIALGEDVVNEKDMIEPDPVDDVPTETVTAGGTAPAPEPVVDLMDPNRITKQLPVRINDDVLAIDLGRRVGTIVITSYGQVFVPNSRIQKIHNGFVIGRDV